jgi:hypothetical protein
MMGVETPIPPIAMDAAAPEGAPPRRFWGSHSFKFGLIRNASITPFAIKIRTIRLR